jgi:hypothetical protein
VVARPVYTDPLIVLRGREAKVEGRTARRQRDRQQVAAIQILAVSRNGVDLVSGVGRPDVPVGPTTIGAGSNFDDLAAPNRPLALDPYKRWSQIEYEVVTLAFGERLQDAEAELRGGTSDRRLRNRALLIGREHDANTSSHIGQNS